MYNKSTVFLSTYIFLVDYKVLQVAIFHIRKNDLDRLKHGIHDDSGQTEDVLMVEVLHHRGLLQELDQLLPARFLFWNELEMSRN